jgi:hypothetical protein
MTTALQIPFNHMKRCFEQDEGQWTLFRAAFAIRVHAACVATAGDRREGI